MQRDPRDVAGTGPDRREVRRRAGEPSVPRFRDGGGDRPLSGGEGARAPRSGRADGPAPAMGLRLSQRGREAFVARFGAVFEHSPWIAEAASALEPGPHSESAASVHDALVRVFRAAPEARRLGVLTAHPDLAGKLAAAGRLTAESAAEQAGAGLDLLTDDERDTFQRLNARYVARHGFPFIIAVKDHDKASILDAFQRRIDNDRDSEFSEACRQVERIAELRLTEMLGG